MNIGIPARHRRRRSSLAGAGKRRAGNWDEALILTKPRRLDESSRQARRCYWNNFRMSCAFWLAIDSDWMPSCSCVWSACNWVDAVFMFASTMPEMPSE